MNIILRSAELIIKLYFKVAPLLESVDRRASRADLPNPALNVQEELVQELLVLHSHLHRCLAVIQRILPRVQQERQPQLPRTVSSQRLLDRDKVLQRLGHLAAGDGEVARVQEITDPVRIVEVRFCLRELVIVVRKF